MKRPAAAVCALLVLLVVAGTAQAKVRSTVKLDQYVATVDAATYGGLLSQGFDPVAVEAVVGGTRIDLVLTPEQASALRGKGIDLAPRTDAAGRSARERAASQLSTGFEVWRDYDGPDGIRAELRALARQNPGIAKLVRIGRSFQGRQILALKLTKGARQVADGQRPAVLYSSLQHAREWIAAEVNRRLLHWYIERWRAKDPEIRSLLRRAELWFVVVANPDGYQYTFRSPDTRLWRKTLRDNDRDGVITIADGVDPNRNFSEHWGYDEEGSSSILSSETYRGKQPVSEPETRAMTRVLKRARPEFQVNYHSAGQWLLYPEGWQVSSASADDPIYYALSGNLDNPAIEDFWPGLSSDVLYVTNGETTDYAHTNAKTLAWTPELSEGCDGCGFVFPDDEALVQAEFERLLLFSLDVAKSARTPAQPVSHLGLETKPFYLQSDDPYKFGLPSANFAFDVSYGDPQPVQVLARRSLGAVKVKYRVNGGAVRSRPTREWNGGERYGGQTDVYYHVMRGQVRGTKPGDSVEVWFEARGKKSESFTYEAAVESNRRVLILSAEDYTGASPVQEPGPHYASLYQDALAAAGFRADVYDVDAMGRKAPDDLGVLSHYDAVVWYTGDDIIPRESGWGGGNMSRLGIDELLNIRAYLNEGGKLLYSGQFAGHGYTPAHGSQLYDPTDANAQCSDESVIYRCLVAHGVGDFQNDVVQYWFGAYLLVDDSGTLNPDTGELYAAFGVDTPFSRLSWTFNGPDSGDNQFHSGGLIATSGILPAKRFPQFRSWASAKWDRPGGPFDPHTGESYVYSQIADVTYKRLTKTIDVPAGGGTLSFWVSRNTELDWDYFFVEAHTPGQDDWTTLQDQNGHNSQDLGPPSTPDGNLASCTEGWRELHPHLDHYQTNNGDGTCSPTGTSGVWWAASGSSGGWEQWSVDLAKWAGGQVEVSLGYASDWSVQGLGVFLDDVVEPNGTSTSFEGDPGGWVVSGSPPGSTPNFNDFILTTAAGFPEGSAVTTRDTVYTGFGLEGVSEPAARTRLVRRAMNYLLR